MAQRAEPPTISTGFYVVSRRWVGERSIVWLRRSRRLSKNYEALPATEAALACLAKIGSMVVRLAR